MISEDSNWQLVFKGYDPEKEKHREALLTVGNGYFGTRGAGEESSYDINHYPGTYTAGLYNRLVSEVSGRNIENEDFVNCPDWTSLNFTLPGGEEFSIDNGEVLDYKRTLKIREGVLIKNLRFRHPGGEITRIKSRRFISMDSAVLAAIKYTIIPENYSGEIQIQSALNGKIENRGVERYNDLNQHHLKRVKEDTADDVLFLQVKTTESEIDIYEAAYHNIFLNEKAVECKSEFIKEPQFVSVKFIQNVEKNDELTIEKKVFLFTSKDHKDLLPENLKNTYNHPDSFHQEMIHFLKKPQSFKDLFQNHVLRWKNLWDEVDVTIEGDDHAQKIIRIHSYHLLITGSHFNKNIDTSIAARGLHGEAYRGHIFWDELYILPFYMIHFPEVARSLLMYRYRRLDKARQYAKEYGYKGAMFPWQSGSSGREETQIMHLNPASGKWGDDYSSLQRHVSLAVAYNVYMYVHYSGDTEFLKNYGAEILFEVCRFWVSKANYNSQTGRYEIKKVMGPNEFHEMMPGSKEGGLKDNAYTNILTSWLLKKGCEIYHQFAEEGFTDLYNRLNLTDTEIKHWREISENLNLVIENGVVSQYDGFFNLEKLDFEYYRKKYQNIGRLDRILKAEGKSPDKYQLSKQADFIMLFYLFPLEEVINLIEQMGYQFDKDLVRKNYDYYLNCTSHGSTLSLVVHSYVAACLGDLKTSLEWFSKSLDADINDIQGGTTKEGIHSGLMAGTVWLTVSAFAGVDFSHDFLKIHPSLPETWNRLTFKVHFRKGQYFIDIDKGKKIEIQYEGSENSSVIVEVIGQKISLKNGQMEKVTY